MSEIGFIRHGESLANAGGIASVPPQEIALTGRGQQQALCLPAVVTAPPLVPLALGTRPAALEPSTFQSWVANC